MDIIALTLLEDKAKSINHLKNEVALNVIEIGRHLKEAREICAHGDWNNWVESNVEFTDRQARSYMQVYEKFGNRNTYSDLGMSKLKLLASLPDDIDTKEFIKNNDVENTPVRQLQTIIHGYKGIEETERKEIAASARAEAEAKSNQTIQVLSEQKAELKGKVSNLNEEIKTKSDRIKELSAELGDKREAERIKADIQKLKESRKSIQKELEEIGELARIKVEVESLLKKVSPVRYMNIFKNRESIVAKKTLSDIVSMFENWIGDMTEILNTIEVPHE